MTNSELYVYRLFATLKRALNLNGVLKAAANTNRHLQIALAELSMRISTWISTRIFA